MFRTVSVSYRGSESESELLLVTRPNDNHSPGCFVPGRFVPLDVSSRDVSSHIMYVSIGDFKI